MSFFKKPQVVVLRQLGGCGDILALTPTLRGLKEKYPRHELVVITGRQYLGGSLYELFSHCPSVDKIVGIEPYEKTTEETRRVWRNYYENTPDIMDEIIIQRANKFIDLNTICAVTENIIEGNQVKTPRYKIWADFAGVEPSSWLPYYVIRPGERETAKQTFEERGWTDKKVIGVALTACDKRRAMSVDKLVSICHGLRERGLTPVTIDPLNTLEGVEYIIGKRISEVIPLIEQMSAVVTADSGVLHMAGAVNTPIVGVFGPTDPEMRMKFYRGSAVDARKFVSCSPCWYQYPCTNPVNRMQPLACLSSIGTDIIVEEAFRWSNL